MDAQRTLGLVLLTGLLGLSGPTWAEPAEAGASAGSAVSKGLLAGKVRDAGTPLAAAGVYAYQLADLTLRKVVTDRDGNFLFRELPAGLYKIIAHKSGFLPAVITLARSSVSADQFVDLELMSADAAEGSAADFWSVRKKIPTDVLHQLGLEEPELAGRQAAAGDRLTAANLESSIAGFNAEMQALAGLNQMLDSATSQLSGGRLELDGQLGSARIAFDGFYLAMAPPSRSSSPLSGTSGRQAAMTLNVSGEGNSEISVASRNTRLDPAELDAAAQGVDFEQVAVTWRAPTGRGESQVSAQYTEESNFYSSQWVDPLDIPDASRTLNIQGTYSTRIGSASTFQTQLRYRGRERSFLSTDSAYAGLLDQEGRFAEESVELTGRGGWRLQPAVLVEYGLTTRLHDGSLSFTPQAGLVLQLGDFWQAIAQASHRVDQDEPSLFQDFVSAFYHEAGACERTADSCYKLAFYRTGEDDTNRLSLGATQRHFGETLRMFFSEDFFNHLEGLFLVRGDRLPELQFAVSRRIAPQILTTLESNLAAGGGGLVYSVTDEPFENQVRYLVTSLDTQFQSTSTGVLLAFHHLQQDLMPLVEGAVARPQLEMERLQVRVTQDLSFLLDLAADWAVHLNMELSRGSSVLGSGAILRDDSELRQSFLGGLAVRF